jgi:hypothetical protein
MGGWRNLHNEELRNCTLFQDDMGRACSMNWRGEGIYVIGGKARRKKTARKTKK